VWITQDQLIAELSAADLRITRRQLERWRNAKLIPPVKQEPLSNGGSVVWYPPGSIEHIREAGTIRPRRFEHVGWELWWRGYPVPERYWRPVLDSTDKALRKAVRLLKPLIDPPDHDEQATAETNPFAEIPSEALRDFPLLHILRRVLSGTVPALLRSITEVATGDHIDFAEPEDGDLAVDENTAFTAFDFAASESLRITGKQFKFRAALGPVLRAISDRDIDRYRLASEQEICAARDDVRRALNLARDFHEATAWIYGPNAFGLRLAALLARKAPRPLKAGIVLLFLNVRSNSNIFYSSDVIAKMESDTKSLLIHSLELKRLSLDPNFRKILHPKRLRDAMTSADNINDWKREFARARNS
jgi:hypothetical protein